MKIYELDYASTRELVLGLDVQADFLSLFNTGGQLRWVIFALLVIGISMRIMAFLTKEASFSGIVGYMLIVPMIISWGFFRMVPVDGINAPFQAPLQVLVDAKTEELDAIKAAKEKVSVGDVLTSHIMETSIISSSAKLTQLKKDKVKLDQSVNGGLKVPVLYAFFYTMSSAMRWSISDGFNKNLYSKDGEKRDAGATVAVQLQSYKAFSREMNSNSAVSDVAKEVYKNVGECVAGQAALKNLIASNIADSVNYVQLNRGKQGFDLNDPDFNKMVDQNSEAVWASAKELYIVCNMQGQVLLTKMRNDPAIHAEAARIKNNFFGGVSDNNRKAVASGFGVPYDTVKDMSDDDVSHYLAFIKHLRVMSERVNDADPLVGIENHFSQGGKEAGAKEKAAGWVSQFLNGFAMYGKTVSIESYHFIIFLFALSFPFAMLIGIIPGMHLKMIGGYFGAMLFIQLWGLGYGMVDVYYGKQFTESLVADARDVKTGSVLGDFYNTTKENIGAGTEGVVDGALSAIGNPSPVTLGLGAYISAKGASLIAKKSVWELAKQGFKGIFRAVVAGMTGLAAGPGAPIVVTAIVVEEAGRALEAIGDEMLGPKNAALQRLSEKMAQMSPVTQAVYNSSLQWQNKRIKNTIETLDGIMAWMYTMVPMFIAFTFFGFYKLAIFLDLGKQGAQIGQATGMMTGMMATRMRGGGR